MPKATLLLYDPTDAPWIPKLKQHCAIQGLRLRPVEPSDLGRTVSVLAQGLAAAGDVPVVPPVPEPMLLFCFLSSAQLDRMLSALRRIGVPRTVLKAVLTPDNAGWTLSALYDELCRERQAMSQT